MPLISYRRCNNLRDILVRATHRRPTPKTPGAFRCNRSRCKTCAFITEGTTFYTFFSTNEQRQILHHIACSSSNLIYMIQCSRCKVPLEKLNVNSATGLGNTDAQSKKPSPIVTLINPPPFQITSFSLATPSKTLEPHGINRRDET